MPPLALSPGLRLQDLPPKAARFCLLVERFCLRELDLDLRGAKLLAAVSGGADSLSLLLTLRCLAPRMGFSLLVGHLDHALRPESASEAVLVAELARRLGLDCVSARVDVAATARERRIGLEEAGRAVRLAFLEQTRQERGCSWTVLGHQLDDLAEDSLMRLLRGSAWPALAGMEGRDDARFLFRPLLLTARADIETFVTAFAVSPLRDVMNEDTAYLRNRVRAALLPLFVAENPAFLDAVAQRWRLARRDAACFASLLPETRGSGQELFVPQQSLRALPEALRLRLYKRSLDRLGPGQVLASTLLALDAAWREGRGGKRFAFPGGKSARVHKGGIRFFYGAAPD